MCHNHTTPNNQLNFSQVDLRAPIRLVFSHTEHIIMETNRMEMEGAEVHKLHKLCHDKKGTHGKGSILGGKLS